jgi:hypothetical protein
VVKAPRWVVEQNLVFIRGTPGSWDDDFVNLPSWLRLNGTYVNTEQVDQTKLASGDEVQIGKFKLTFFAAGE